MISPTPCNKCLSYFQGWRSHSPEFPSYDWNVIEKTDIQVGTHAPVDVMEGKATCKSCGMVAIFSCTYGDGYYFSTPTNYY